jgi:hypothetical protein
MKNYTDTCYITKAAAEVALYPPLVTFPCLEHTFIYTEVGHITVLHNGSFAPSFTLIKPWRILSEVDTQRHSQSVWLLCRIPTGFLIRIFK